VLWLLGMLPFACHTAPEAARPAPDAAPVPATLEEVVARTGDAVRRHVPRPEGHRIATVLFEGIEGGGSIRRGGLDLGEAIRAELNRENLGRVRFVHPDQLGAVSPGGDPDWIQATLAGSARAPRAAEGAPVVTLRLRVAGRATAPWEGSFALEERAGNGGGR